MAAIKAAPLALPSYEVLNCRSMPAGASFSLCRQMHSKVHIEPGLISFKIPDKYGNDFHKLPSTMIVTSRFCSFDTFSKAIRQAATSAAKI